MDRVKAECYQNNLRRTGPSVRSTNRKFNDDQHLGSSENHHSSGGNNKARSKRPIGRQSQPGSGDTTRPLPCPQSLWRGEPNRVLIVYGLERMNVNCDKVFNLFCIYGNVTAVKILNGNQVLVELQDVEAAKRCVSKLNLIRLDKTTNLKVKYSKHSYINDHGTSRTLSDGTPAKKIYLKSKFNRFVEKEMKYADQRRLATPSKILHFYNAPLDICAKKMHKVVTDALGSMDAIRSITILPKKRPDAKCSTGLIEMKSNELAVKTILLLNHMPFESSKSRFPFLTKLSFSKWSDIRQQSTGSSKLLLSIAPCIRRSFHNSEHASPTVELAVARTTQQTTSPGGISWTLWEIRDVVTEAIDRGTGNLVRPTETFQDQLRVTHCDNLAT
ncbi:heterogeneous nuclear ribonucleoprotein L-like [Sipha flava]|uniref:Heterogeneous nuclear ribonucleoprotein L-like n=2 Tax=Sipha flava TaxID=143950 RepID=A0A8B8F9T1_9HEMI|nr:heterogeneous nuclear ribonucleoprotein L-like [Sipha flava]XP_025407549.1 heterogeneous nuclear ribonucleoprotein L-like [Sipha flava]XP_025407551.1 heterogeneous nuclear ribonucleoprotein L-like [Sipha flava]